FVIVTEFIGSGDRARTLLDAIWNVASIRSWHSGKFIKFWVIAYSGTDIGVHNVRSHRFSPNVHIVNE
ncbi:phosphoribosyltransferase-like protein, partial [Pseudomonas aeruginosa]